MTAKKKDGVTSKCVVCGKTITHTVVLRKYCRGGQCRELFNHLKKAWKKDTTSHLIKSELLLFKKLKKDGVFENSVYKKKEEEINNLVNYA